MVRDVGNVIGEFGNVARGMGSAIGKFGNMAESIEAVAGSIGSAEGKKKNSTARGMGCDIGSDAQRQVQPSSTCW